jgi:apolipoprotein N-acyltransferase
MIKIIPWDIWAAAALALAVALAGIFGPIPVAFIVIFLGLCVYVVVQAIKGEPR